MFGHRPKGQPDHEQEIEVDVDLTLERDISTVVQAVDAYLQNTNEGLRKDLLTALEHLDDQTDRADAYQGRPQLYPADSGSAVVGATSDNSMPEELPSTEFQAQVALVRAAKNAVTRLTPDTLADLRAANDALAEWRTADQ